jgi:hypothetical protein
MLLIIMIGVLRILAYMISPRVVSNPKSESRVEQSHIVQRGVHIWRHRNKQNVASAKLYPALRIIEQTVGFLPFVKGV